MIKTGKYTPRLVAFAVLVALAKSFIFNPPDSAIFLDYFSDIVGTGIGLNGQAIGVFIDFLFPVMGAAMGLVTFYMSSVLTASGIPTTPYNLLNLYLTSSSNESNSFFISDTKTALACEIAIIEYVLILHFLEKFHSELHEDESIFCICVDMTCIEYISMYLLAIVSFIENAIIAILPDFFEYFLFSLEPLIGRPVVEHISSFFGYFIIALVVVMLIIAAPLYLAWSLYIFVDFLITAVPLGFCLYWMTFDGWFGAVSVAEDVIEGQFIFINNYTGFAFCIVILLAVALLTQIFWRKNSELVHMVVVLIVFAIYGKILDFIL